jgi:hypothetical protein
LYFTDWQLRDQTEIARTHRRARSFGIEGAISLMNIDLLLPEQQRRRPPFLPAWA